MRPDRPAPAVPSGRGFALISAIFLLVVLSGLGVFIVTLSGVQNVTSTQDLQGARAYQAARAGFEWSAYQVLQNTRCATSSTLDLPGITLAGLSVLVQCAARTYEEGTRAITIYQITSTATFGVAGTTTYVERQLAAAIETCLLDGIPCVN
ncbi:pilus assembly PilX N-terminal domain-containing protein [Actimicrobium sp. CCC2.4]|uniref:pilus assembly PilX N-terminal domain-containing protein n=1 Tax=Actimicrobium sp. CCC2.4 TaxID=3048606 RepID=UPI002AC8D5CC|nr:pilus assembly PilX N-terminal domain-containing protein [Actimicrobium sp. CCC2.4]MEB0134703.1 pilus assembly PilX N-terminal domain-containing protein [Actimicrobium sp. CCC2.4]WPX30646.1 pilus assembly PilX N-terminal domain-containing protein [Actimicrobium sp. CCC2.4]